MIEETYTESDMAHRRDLEKTNELASRWNEENNVLSVINKQLTKINEALKNPNTSTNLLQYWEILRTYYNNTKLKSQNTIDSIEKNIEHYQKKMNPEIFKYQFYDYCKNKNHAWGTRTNLFPNGEHTNIRIVPSSNPDQSLPTASSVDAQLV